MKFLCMCQGGNVRSVGLAYALKYTKGIVNQDALACSWERNSQETLDQLFQWADYIVVMETYMTEKVPEQYKSKMRVVDVGPDNYGSAFHSGLQSFLQRVVKQWNERQFKI